MSLNVIGRSSCNVQGTRTFFLYETVFSRFETTLPKESKFSPIERDFHSGPGLGLDDARLVARIGPVAQARLQHQKAADAVFA